MSSSWDEAKPYRGSSDDMRIAKRLVEAFGDEGAHRALDALLDQFTNVELAALSAHWPMWGRDKQLPPPGEWRSWGDLTARGFGKTMGKANFINEEVQAGRVRRIGLCAQSEAKTIDVQVYGLIETAPPWCRPTWEVSSMELTWPNGATARAFTPEVPDIIRSENLDLAWLSEVQSHPVTTREETFSNFLFATRVGGARTIWDATPKKGHPILKRLLARAEKHPDKHYVVRGTIYENPHLAAGVIADMETEYADTRKGREELLGEMLDESEAALVKQTWINDNRRPMPDRLVRRIIVVDPAKTSRAGSDQTGLLDLGLAPDGQLMVCGDHTSRYKQAEWMDLAFDRYIAGRCDLLLLETNTLQDALFEFIAMLAERRGLDAVKVTEERTTHVSRVIYVKEVFGRGPKEDRAQPMATAYERGRISHVEGVDLGALEISLTTWEPQKGMRSPDAIDALAHGTVELLGSQPDRAAAKRAMQGVVEVNRRILAPTRPSIATLLGGGGTGGGRI